MPGPFDLPQMPGATGSIFDSDAYRRNMLWDGLTNAGLGLIQASAPSPYPQDFGTVFGGLAGGAARGMQAGEDKYLKRAMLDTQVQQAKSKLERDKAWTDMFKGAQPTPDAGGVPQPGWNKEVAPGGVQGNPAAGAIAGIESAGQPNNGYGAVGPVADQKGSRAYGKYQVMDYNIGPWTQEVLGRAMTPQEFLANPQAQDALFNAKFRQFTQQNGGDPQKAAAVWFSGRPDTKATNIQDVNGMTPNAYVNKFVAAGGAAPPNAGGQGDGAQVTPVQYQQPPAQQPKSLAQVVQGLPPGVRQIIGVMGPEAGIKELLKYADPETVPVIDNQSGQVVFAPKTELNSGRYSPLDAKRLANDDQRLALDKQRTEADLANKDVLLDPSGRTVPNAPLLDFKKQVSAAQGTDPEGKIRTEIAQDAVKRNSDWQKSAVTAQSTIHNVKVFESLADQVKTGKFVGTITDLKSALKGAGVNLEAMGIPDNIAPAQAMQMLSQRFALEMRQEMPGPMSDGDRKFMVAGSIGIERDPNANKIMAEWIKGNAQRSVDRAKFAREYMQSPDFVKNPAGIDDFVDAKIAGKDYFNHDVLPKQSYAPAGAIPEPGKIRRYNPEKGVLE